MSMHHDPNPTAIPEIAWGADGIRQATVGETAEFAELLSGLTRTGLPLPSGLRALSAELPSNRLRRVLIETANRLELGSPLDEAAIGLSERFPPHLRGLIVAGARSGKLADVLGQFVRYASLGSSLRRRFVFAVAYPLFLLIVLGGLYVFLSVWIVQAFEFVLKDFGVQVPAITRTLFAIGRFTREQGLWLLLTVVASGAIALVMLRLFATPVQRRRFAISIPLYGPMLRWSVLAEFCHMVGLLVESEMPLPQALALAGQGVNDADLEKTGLDLRKSVERGRSLSQSLVLWNGCPAGLREVLDGSEGRGDLAPSLHMAGDMFEARTRAQASFASSLFAILTVMLVIWGIGFIITALYMPMISLIARLSG